MHTSTSKHNITFNDTCDATDVKAARVLAQLYATKVRDITNSKTQKCNFLENRHGDT